MVSDRSSQREVRNPLLSLPAAERIRSLPPETRQALAALLHELSLYARERAQRCWRQGKAPMAVYWKAVSVYAGHLYRVTRPTKTELAGADAAHPFGNGPGMPKIWEAP